MRYVNNDILGSGFGLPTFAVRSNDSYMGFHKNRNDTQFKSLSELKYVVDRMDEVTTVPLYRLSDEGSHIDSGKKAIISTKYGDANQPLTLYQQEKYKTFGKTYDAVSGRYVCVQDAHVFGQLCDAFSDAGYENVCGYVRGLGSGQSKVDSYVIDDDAKFTLGNHRIFGKSDDGFFGISAWNGHNGKSSVGMSISAIRQICTNGMMGLKVLGKVFKKHATGVHDFTKTFEGRFNTALKHKDDLEEAARLASAHKLPIEKYESILWGVGFGKRHIEQMINPTLLAPEIETIGLSPMTAYYAVTSYLSHSDNSGKYSGSTENRFAMAGDIINSKESLAKLIQMGEVAKKKFEAKEKAKTVPEMVVPNVAYL